MPSIGKNYFPRFFGGRDGKGFFAGGNYGIITAGQTAKLFVTALWAAQSGYYTSNGQDDAWGHPTPILSNLVP